MCMHTCVFVNRNVYICVYSYVCTCARVCVCMQHKALCTHSAVQQPCSSPEEKVQAQTALYSSCRLWCNNPHGTTHKSSCWTSHCQSPGTQERVCLTKSLPLSLRLMQRCSTKMHFPLCLWFAQRQTNPKSHIFRQQ